MGDLMQSVDPSIGSSRSMHLNWFIGNGGDRVAERGLNGASVCLSLPADEIGTVVFAGKRQSRHCCASRIVGLSAWDSTLSYPGSALISACASLR
jgi:hypothetical protein